jgi:hypothetical protein
MAFGTELWPSLSEKAAALFHSLSCNHCFFNGNKRTADLFLAANQHLLTMTSDEVYLLAKRTATANAEGRELESVMAELSSQISDASVSLELLSDDAIRKQIPKDVYEKIMVRAIRLAKRLEQALEAAKTLSPPES